MKRTLATALVLGLTSACAAPAPPPESSDAGGPAASTYEASPEDRDAILAAVQGVFDALRTGDAELLRSVMNESVVMHSSEIAADGSISSGSSTVAQLAERIQGGNELIERMWDAEVRVDGALAMVWTPYDFYVGSTFSHCGVDTATLVKRDTGWELVALSWTRRQPPACPLHPAGPPEG